MMDHEGGFGSFSIERILRSHRRFQLLRWPKGYWGWLAALLIGWLLALVIALVYFTGGTKLVYAHSAYVPVALGGFLFGVPGGVSVALLVGLGLGPWMPLDVAAGIPQSTANWLYRTGFLVTVGLLTGGMCASLGHQVEAMRRLAYRDRLTGLPNRIALIESLSTVQNPEWAKQLLILRLRQYQEVLLWLGQSHADELQRTAATRFRQSLLPYQRLYDLGDGLFGVINDVHHPTDSSKRLAMKLSRSLDKPLLVSTIPLLVEAHCGIVDVDTNSGDGLSVLRRATVALARAEGARRPFAYFDDHEDRQRRNLINLLPDLRTALQQGETQLKLHYQPKLDLRSGRCCSVEALARWQHPEHGPVAPNRFIPSIEGTQLIGPFTSWVIDQALRDLTTHRWDDLIMAVNISVRNLEDETFPARLEALLDRHKLSGERLELEITESALIMELDSVLHGLERLRRSGVRVALDDFGTGLSSLSYLKDLPVDVIKLDRSFLATDPRAERIVAGTIGIAHDLGFEVVAEGIENVQTYDWLRANHCDLGQGYFIGRPMPAPELTAWLDQHTRGDRTAPAGREPDHPRG